MANSLAPFGFSHVGVLDGVQPTFAQSTKGIAPTYATQIFTGDPVTTASGLMTLSTPGTAQIHGIFQGCKYLSVSQGVTRWSPFWPGADVNPAGAVEVYVSDSPTSTFLVQANAQLLPSHVGKNANFAAGTGSTATGRSGFTLDVSTIATTATLPFRIVSLVTVPVGSSGADQTSPYGWAIVTFNNQDFKSLTGL